jgi:hypothetical protein
MTYMGSRRCPQPDAEGSWPVARLGRYSASACAEEAVTTAAAAIVLFCRVVSSRLSTISS